MTNYRTHFNYATILLKSNIYIPILLIAQKKKNKKTDVNV